MSCTHPPSVRVRVLTLQFNSSLGAFDERPLATFLADKELLDLREQFFAVHGLPYLVCVITYRAPAGVAPAPPRTASPHSRAQTRAPLDPAEIPLFETLRAWRRERAQRDGVPPYVVLTNRELVAILRARPITANGLQQIDGVGQGKTERYGPEILAHFTRAAATEATAS